MDKVKRKIEKAVERGDITREDADKTYSRYRSRAIGLKQVRRDPVIENHFKDLGVDDLNKLKNEMLDQGIPGDRLMRYSVCYGWYMQQEQMVRILK